MKKYDIRYVNTLQLIFLKALKDEFPNNNCTISNSINHYLYGQIDFETAEISEAVIKKIKDRMQELIAQKLALVKRDYSLDEMKEMAREKARPEVLKLLKYSLINKIYVYDLDGYLDFFYAELYDNTSVIDEFDLVAYKKGFILKYPVQRYGITRKFNDKPKMIHVFEKTKIWNSILGVDFIGSLNEKIINSDIKMLIKINETLHNNRIAEIAYTIKHQENIKLITIAGPSSSGKTTFSNKLYLSLRAFELNPLVISLDNYYIGRDKLPLDKNGNKDFETIKALDVELLNQNLLDLIEKGEAELPIYNFKIGERESFTRKVSIDKNDLIIIEGIHGLNEELTYQIPKELKFKIYVSCLTQLNIDAHNRVSTTDVRKIRRIVRDSLSRGASSEETLAMWDSVKAGEEKYIFPYQEDADIMFNSSLVYELGILKTPAIKQLLKIEEDSPQYQEARRLINLLECFLTIESSLVPDDSLLKEFIGNSFFYNY